MKAKYTCILILVVLMDSMAGCEKLVSVSSPYTTVTGADAFSSDATAAAVMTGLYTTISAAGQLSNGFVDITLLGGLSADEFTLWSGATNQAYVQYFTNALLSTAPITSSPWIAIYPYIFTCNSTIQGVTASTSLSAGVKQQLLGEATFMRAFCYFYLVNLYGDVPMPLGTSYNQNDTLSRTPKAQVFQQIIADLKTAESLLSPTYVNATLLAASTARVRPVKWAAAALLARVYLYTGQWDSAEIQASSVINNTSLFRLAGLDTVFLKTSAEAIWQLQPVNTGYNTEDARTFVVQSTGPSNTNPVYLSSSLLNSFETGDQRRIHWVGSVTAGGVTYRFPYKYKINTINTSTTFTSTEYQTVLRLAEQYLVRAEARAQQNNISGAQQDLDTVRRRAGLPITAAGDKASLLTAILHERQVELFCEWAHRWLDLKRTGAVDTVMSTVTPAKLGGSWNLKDELFPIPVSELQRDPRLVQNPGY